MIFLAIKAFPRSGLTRSGRMSVQRMSKVILLLSSFGICYNLFPDLRWDNASKRIYFSIVSTYPTQMLKMEEEFLFLTDVILYGNNKSLDTAENCTRNVKFIKTN